MGCCQSAEDNERDPLLDQNGQPAAPVAADTAKAAETAPAASNAAASPAAGANNAGGGLFQQGAAPQLAAMQDDGKGDNVIGDGGAKIEDADAAAAAKQEDSKSAAVISDTQKKLIDLTTNEDEDDAAAADEAAGLKVDGSIRVGATDSFVAVPNSPAKENKAATAVPVEDDDDDAKDLAASVSATKERDMARRMGTSLAADVHSVATAQPVVEPQDVVKNLGDVHDEEKKDDDKPKDEEEKPKEDAEEKPTD